MPRWGKSASQLRLARVGGLRLNSRVEFLGYALDCNRQLFRWDRYRQDISSPRQRDRHRSVGSGNIGATNVFRVLGKTAGISVLLIDALKGFVGVRVISRLGRMRPAKCIAMVAGLFAILGHNYTCWLRFKGGKGVATVGGSFAGAGARWIRIALVTVSDRAWA